MLRDVTLGRYYGTGSIIHRLDPRFKIRFILLYLLILLLDRNVPLFLMLTGVLAVTIALSGIPFGHILRGTKSIFIVIFICSCINMISTAGETLLSLGICEITREGIIKSAFIFWRMVLMILMSSMLMYTTTPTELTDGIEKCFHLSSSIAMGITIALRFIPILFEELGRIMKAMEARGADYKSGGIIRRLKGYKKILIPLFQNSINRATGLAEAMDARCYRGGKGRTKLHPLVYGYIDLIAYAMLVAIIAFGIWMVFRF